MMDSIANQVLGSLDPKVLYICIGVLAISLVLTLVKKAVWLAIVLAVCLIGSTVLVPIVKEYQDTFSISVTSEGLSLLVDGEPLVLSKELGINNVKMVRLQSGEYNLIIGYNPTDTYGKPEEITEDNPGSSREFKIPGFMRSPVVKYLDKSDIAYKVEE